ncbi:hypothetical protein [Streptoalloteichus hindustanus]|uniref:Uncharacterized protein n=1 Tax=Streptoalloteichus hindustanus TaxID=2017 RepID=A0A1M5CN75_STRHI|nr:hypothetical protein [Streptoalloteichus hindustanus]SHF56067.1 hypothetical protein SAMN05444320_10494 [Streptoalloteichus hindustanus]
MSDELHWAIFDGNAWSPKGQIGTCTTSHAPALAVYKNALYCAYTATDKKVNWMKLNGSWSDPAQIADSMSSDAPALAVAQDKLYCAHRGADHDTKLYSVALTGNTWESTRSEISGVVSSLGPGLATYKNNLYCVCYDDQTKKLATQVRDAGQWKVGPAPDGSPQGAPALAAYQARLWCAYPGKEEGSSLNWTTLVGTSWRAEQDFPQHVGGSKPALSVYSGLLHCFHLDTDGSSLSWSTSRGDGWSQDQRTGLRSKSAPGVAPLADKLYCVYVNPSSHP